MEEVKLIGIGAGKSVKSSECQGIMLGMQFMEAMPKQWVVCLTKAYDRD